MAEVVIFDMDGTLLDTAKGTVAALWECAPRFHLPPLPAETIRSAIGWAVPEFYRRLYPECDDETLLRFGEETSKREGEILLALGKALLFPGVEALLQALCQEGKNVYLASTGSEAHVSVCLRATGIAPFFAAVFCGEPDKAGMLSQIVRRHPDAEAVMIGDTVKDAQAARANGLPVIGAGFGYCDASRAALFNRVAATPEQLLRWVR